jgi:heat shock protein HslJ
MPPLHTSAQRLRVRLRATVVAVTGLLALSACGSQPVTAPPEGPTLRGSEWRLQELDGRPVPSSSVATLSFPQAGRVAGHGACNRFMGGVTVGPQGRLQFGQLATTRMACEQAVNEQETRYLAALQQVQAYELQGQTLLLFVPGQAQPLRLKRTSP